VKILISMLHVVNHGGAAMVMLELAEQFRSEGHEVDICTWWSGSPMHDYFAEAGVRRLENLQRVNPFDYDIVFFLHQNAPLHFPVVKRGSKDKTLILFFRLSHSSNIGVPAAVLDQLIMDKTLVNSEEVRRRMIREFGLPPEKIDVFYNASPSAFEREAPTECPDLRRVLYVSNHQTTEVVGALEVLRKTYGIETLHVGEGGDKQVRATPDVVGSADVVITMAKTAQYALLSRKPLYVYDYHWGGPGYLNVDNFCDAADHNFSGSYSPRKKSSTQIAAEVVGQYKNAWSFVVSLEASALARYRLDHTLQRIYQLYEHAELNEQKIERLQRNHYLVKRERCYTEQFYIQYRKSRAAGNKLSAIRKVLE
jgi:hypothetical protein